MKNVVLWYVVIGIIALALEIAVASKFEEIANEKGYSGYFWWCFWLNIIGYFMVAALPDRKGNKDIITAIEKSGTASPQQAQPQYQQPQQTYWNNNLPPL